MNTKHTLKSLCDDFDKIEIPIIQRDYAQGREEQTTLRSNFVNYLIKALTNQTPIELDFIYGNIRLDQETKNSNKTISTFIPIDGQQRLTTLWLLHWFLAVKENRLPEISSWMHKFSYETRPSSHDFCHRLMTEQFPKEHLTKIDEFIQNQSWFDNEWNHDGTVSGMLRMLKTFRQYQTLLDGTITLDQLLLRNAISFYFVPLEQFGLSEELYIRMNARGKVLTDFENFKSEFYKIIKNNPHLDEVKDKMESAWVENLWPFRKKKIFVTDDYFMNYLKVLTRMLYFHQAKARADEYADDFLDLELLREIYSNPDNAGFLFYAFDIIPEITEFNKGDLLWEEGTTLSDILADAIKGGGLLVDKMVILYASLLFYRQHKDRDKLMDYIKVIRNLICNTNDKSERDQPRILRSIEKLSNDADVYDTLSKSDFSLEGFRDSQCKEEHFKALLILKYPESKTLISQMEDNPNLRGNISALLAGTYVNREKEIATFEFSDHLVEEFDLNRLHGLFQKYRELSKSGFEKVWGDLLNTSLYTHNKASGRMVFDDKNFSRDPAVIALAVSFLDSGMTDLETFLIATEKKTIKKLSKKYEDFGAIRNVKLQLYLYYVLTRRIMMLGIHDFFKNGWRFGWLQKEKGFVSLFYNGIDGDPWFSENGHNPIFQTYNSQFRYNWGLDKSHALPPEIVGTGRPQKAFDRLIEWAEE